MPHSSAVPNTTKYNNEERQFDVGVKAWLQVLGAFFLYFNSWGIINIFGVFETYYKQYTLSDKSASSIAWIGSVQSALLLLVGVISGPFFDAGYFYTLLPIGSFLVCFGLLMTSFSTEYYQIMLSQGICVGIGTGCLFVPSVALLPQYFKKRRALANGIAASGSSIGGVLYPIVFHRLQGKIGFPWATRVVSFLALATCAISVSTMRLRFRPSEKRALLHLSAFKELQYTLFCLSCFLGFLGFYNFLVYVQPYAIETRIVDDNLGFYLVAILNAASTAGRVVPNLFADHTGSLNMLIPALTVTGLLAYCWVAIGSTSGIITLSALYGFFSGGFVSLVPVVMMTITTDFSEFGTRLGMCFALESIALLIGTPVGGAILNSTGSYLGVQLFCGSCLAACALVLMIVRFLRSGPKFIYKT
ncbi:MFS general substrate transporter [Periconia macrospinosa]|uniref:MFS general substrate transporter n=1 Tax=Periconia macrospinosa TaxID=97972 RepID=A0A2V1DCI5_9PLEO|nr:MFS general substrate transporter [Periconia macrospinosa]